MGGELSGVTGEEDEECDLHVKDLIGPRKVLVLNRANAIVDMVQDKGKVPGKVKCF